MQLGFSPGDRVDPNHRTESWTADEAAELLGHLIVIRIAAFPEYGDPRPALTVWKDRDAFQPSVPKFCERCAVFGDDSLCANERTKSFRQDDHPTVDQHCDALQIEGYCAFRKLDLSLKSRVQSNERLLRLGKGIGVVDTRKSYPPRSATYHPDA